MAAGSTYTPIQTYTVSSATSTITFSSIPSTYTDLVLVTTTKSTAAASGRIRFNNDSGTNYSWTWLNGNGSTAASGRQSNTTCANYDNERSGISTTSFDTTITHIPNYNSTTVYKTVLSRSGAADTSTEASISTWRNTAAVTTVTVFNDGGNYVTGSTFTLYGITCA